MNRPGVSNWDGSDGKHGFGKHLAPASDDQRHAYLQAVRGSAICRWSALDSVYPLRAYAYCNKFSEWCSSDNPGTYSSAHQHSQRGAERCWALGATSLICFHVHQIEDQPIRLKINPFLLCKFTTRRSALAGTDGYSQLLPRAVGPLQGRETR